MPKTEIPKDGGEGGRRLRTIYLITLHGHHHNDPALMRRSGVREMVRGTEGRMMLMPIPGV